MYNDISSGYTIAKLLPFDLARTHALIIGCSGRKTRPKIYELRGPIGFERNHLVIALLNHLNQSQSDKFQQNYALYHVVSKFFTWISHTCETIVDLPYDIIQQYSNYLNGGRLQQASVCQYITKLRVAVSAGIDQLRGDNHGAEHFETLNRVLEFIPSIPNRRAGTRESISQITESPCSDELMLVRSVIRFCCAFLSKMDEFRKILISNSEVSQKLDALIALYNGDVKQLSWGKNGAAKKAYYKSILKAILDSGNSELKEFILFNKIDFYEAFTTSHQSFPADFAQTSLAGGMTPKGNLDYTQPQWPAPFLFSNVDFLFLIKPCAAEETCLAWLLATDRIQLSGMDALTLDDVHVTASTVSITFEKLRSGEKYHETCHHRRGSVKYETIARYVNLRESYLSKFESSKTSLMDLHSSGSLQVANSDVFRPLIVAANPHTSFYKSLRSQNPEIVHFARIIQGVAEHNKVLQMQAALSSAVRKGGSAQDAFALMEIKKRISVEKIQRQSITINKIAQSRAILDDDIGGSEQISENSGNNQLSASPDENYRRFSQSTVSAASNAHTEATKQEVYINRSGTEYRWEKRASFAAKVGQLMEADARKILELKIQNKFVTVNELKEELGWAGAVPTSGDVAEFDTLVESMQRQGWSITPFGQLELKGNRIIILSPVEVALLITYRQACEKSLESVTEWELLRGSALVMQIAYIEAVLERFDSKTLAAGQDILKRYVFPMPIIR